MSLRECAGGRAWGAAAVRQAGIAAGPMAGRPIPAELAQAYAPLPGAAPPARPHLLPRHPAAARLEAARTCTRSTASPGTPTRSSTAPTTLPPAERAAAAAATGPTASSPGCAASRSTTRCCPRCCTPSRSFDLDRADFASFLGSMAMDLTVTAYADYDDLLSLHGGFGGGHRHDDAADPRPGRPGRRPRAGPAARPGLPAHQLHPRRRRGPRPRPRSTCRSEDLARFGVTARRPARGRRAAAAPPRRSGASSRTRSSRARAHYAAAAPGIPMLAPRLAGLHPHRVPRSTAAILDEVERADHDVFARRAVVARAGACRLLARGPAADPGHAS